MLHDQHIGRGGQGRRQGEAGRRGSSGVRKAARRRAAVTARSRDWRIQLLRTASWRRMLFIASSSVFRDTTAEGSAGITRHCSRQAAEIAENVGLRENLPDRVNDPEGTPEIRTTPQSPDLFD